MQDYNYLEEGIYDLTLEISCCKFPNETTLQSFWVENRDALINYILQVDMGKAYQNNACSGKLLDKKICRVGIYFYFVVFFYIKLRTII